MSVCKTTGLSQEQQDRWPHLYNYLVEEIVIPDLTTIEESYIQKLDSDLKNVIKKIGDAICTLPED